VDARSKCCLEHVDHLCSVFFFPIFSCCTKSGDQPQEDLAKSGCKTNKVENLGILLHVCELLNILAKSWQFHNFLEMWQFFWKISKNSLDHVALHLFLIAKWQIFNTKKIRVSAFPFHTALTDVDCCRLKMLSGLFGELATGLLLRIGGRQLEIILKPFLLRYRCHHVKERDDCNLNIVIMCN
jgi:hypothetical protein